MVNDAVTLGIGPADGDPLRALALGYAPREAREGIAALFALDATFAGIVRRTRDPLAAQLRLAWWDEALRALDGGQAPAGQPLLAALNGAVLPRGITGGELASMIDGWEALLTPGEAVPDDYAAARGALFGLADRVAEGGAAALTRAAGQGWALADLGRVVAALDEEGSRAAEPLLSAAAAARWPSRARFLGALVHAKRGGEAAGTVARLLVHRLTGR